MNESEVRVDGVPIGENPAEDSAADATPTGDKADGDKTLEDKVIAVLREVHDPEIPVNIYELGLIYGIEIDPNQKVTINMTLTSPACPVAESLPLEVRSNVGRIPEVTECEVELVWDPPRGPDRMSEVAKAKLGMM